MQRLHGVTAAVAALVLAPAATAAGTQANARFQASVREAGRALHRQALPKRRPAGMPSRPSARELRSLSVRSAPLVVAVDHQPRAERLLRRAGAEPVFAQAGIWRLPARHSSLLAELASLGVLRSVSPTGVRIARAGWETEPFAGSEWWLPATGANRYVPPGAGVSLTVIDSGLDTSHPEFAGRANTVLLNPQSGFAEDPHGTMVASVAAAALNGVGIGGLYPNALLQSWDDGGGSCPEVVAGFDRVARTDGAYGMINFSAGWDDPDACPALYDAVALAFGRGFITVASAGNEREFGSPEEYPAGYPHVITVAASDSADRVSGFSNQGLGIDLTAPGQDMLVAVPFSYDPQGWLLADGTSFAAPLVSAAGAWAWTLRGGFDGADQTQIFELLREGTRDVGAPGWDADTGFGILSMPALLTVPLPASDHSEPNDDVYQVKANGLFSDATPALLPKGKTTASLQAFVDLIEDPVDVYRVFVPGKRAVSLTVRPTADVDLEVFRPNAQSIYYENRAAALRGPLVGGSYGRARSVERFTVRNRGRVGDYVYVCVFKSQEDHEFLDASYTLDARVTK